MIYGMSPTRPYITKLYADCMDEYDDADVTPFYAVAMAEQVRGGYTNCQNWIPELDARFTQEYGAREIGAETYDMFKANLIRECSARLPSLEDRLTIYEKNKSKMYDLEQGYSGNTHTRKYEDTPDSALSGTYLTDKVTETDMFETRPDTIRGAMAELGNTFESDDFMRLFITRFDSLFMTTCGVL